VTAERPSSAEQPENVAATRQVRHELGRRRAFEGNEQ